MTAKRRCGNVNYKQILSLIKAIAPSTSKSRETTIPVDSPVGKLARYDDEWISE